MFARGESGMQTSPRISIAVIASREHPDTLRATLQTLFSAAHKPATIDVVVNGNRLLAEDIRGQIVSLYQQNSTEENSSVEFRLWFIGLGDKAHAWNTYVHRIWPGYGATFFVDGYVRAFPNALQLLEQGLDSGPDVWCSSGVPSVGRSAGSLRRRQFNDHGIHGNLFCLSGEAMQCARAKNFHLPLGLYRVDSTIEAVIKYSFDPKDNAWNANRVYVESRASWETDEKRWWSWSDIKGQFKRLVRQAQGDLENQAVRHHLTVCKRPAEEMPYSASELVERWILENPPQSGALLRNPLRRYALDQVRKSQSRFACSVLPERFDESA